MPNKLQIGISAYKKNNEYAKTYPLHTEYKEELKQATKDLFCNACDMFIFDLMNYCTNTSGLCAENRLVKENK